MYLKFLALLPVIALAGCMGNTSVNGAAHTLVLNVPHHHRRVALKTIAVQFDFPDGETHTASAVMEVNPHTGRPLRKGLRYTFVSNGEDLGRVGFKAIVGSIIPAATMGASNIAAAHILRNGGSVFNNNAYSYSSAASSSSSSTRVRVNN